jgi:hypothetical protein
MTRLLVCFNIGLLTTAVGLLSTGCAKISRFVASANPYHSATYEGVYEKWTREARVHRGLEVVLIATATFKSEEFRRAYAEEYAKAHRLAPEEKRSLLEEQLGAARLGHDFILASFVPDKRWDDFHNTNATWRLYLVNEMGERVAPLEVRKLKGREPVVSHFFPHITPHKSVYVVSFPDSVPGGGPPFLREGVKAVTLVITGVLGTAQMRWEFE